MEIRLLSFEQVLTLTINAQTIEITPFKIKDDLSNIKLGISAPRGISIDREEIKQRKIAQQTP